MFVMLTTALLATFGVLWGYQYTKSPTFIVSEWYKTLKTFIGNWTDTNVQNLVHHILSLPSHVFGGELPGNILGGKVKLPGINSSELLLPTITTPTLPEYWFDADDNSTTFNPCVAASYAGIYIPGCEMRSGRIGNETRMRDKNKQRNNLPTTTKETIANLTLPPSLTIPSTMSPCEAAKRMGVVLPECSVLTRANRDTEIQNKLLVEKIRAIIKKRKNK